MRTKHWALNLRGTAVICVPLFVAIYGNAVAQSTREDDDARKELVAQYTAISRAFEKNRMDEVIATLSPDFVSSQPGGRSRTREQVIADFKQQREGMRSVQWKRKIESVGLKGGVVIVIVEGRMTAQVGEPGRQHKMVFTSKSMDSWKRTAEIPDENGKPARKHRWLLMEANLLEAHFEMDGKPADLYNQRKSL